MQLNQESYYGVLFADHPRPFQKLGIIHLCRSLTEAKRRAQGLRERMFGQVLARDIPILEENYRVVIID